MTEQILDDDLRDFCKHNCAEHNNFEDLFEKIKSFDIKN